MWRVFGISMSLPFALHTVASQHISTLHNTSGTHILRYVPAQVKHHLRATRFFTLHTTHIAVRMRVRDDRYSRAIWSLQDVAFVRSRTQRAHCCVHAPRQCNRCMPGAVSQLQPTHHAHA
jgi:hypothetical protein